MKIKLVIFDFDGTIEAGADFVIDDIGELADLINE